jgi:hypothetical protein
MFSYAWGLIAGNVEAVLKDRIIDIKKVKFDVNNQAHQDFLSERMQNFVNKRDKLMNFDLVCGVPVGVTALWITGVIGSWGPWLSLVACVAAYQYYPAEGRNLIHQEFKLALQDLFALYRWCAAEQKPGVACNANFLQLIKTIIPYTQDKHKLAAWEPALQVDLLVPRNEVTTGVSQTCRGIFANTLADVRLKVYGNSVIPEESGVTAPQMK